MAGAWTPAGILRPATQSAGGANGGGDRDLDRLRNEELLLRSSSAADASAAAELKMIST
jgi:hypothetical protein